MWEKIKLALYRIQRSHISDFKLYRNAQFLGMFAKLWKVTISFVMPVSVCLSVHMEELISHWKDFQKIWYLGIFWKSVNKIQVSLKSDKNDGYVTWRPTYIYDNISLNSS